MVQIFQDPTPTSMSRQLKNLNRLKILSLVLAQSQNQYIKMTFLDLANMKEKKRDIPKLEG